MDTVAVVSEALEVNANKRAGRISSIWLTLIAASIVPIFLACVSTLSCQQRHYIESMWGGIAVFASILIYSLGKRHAHSPETPAVSTTLMCRWGRTRDLTGAGGEMAAWSSAVRVG